LRVHGHPGEPGHHIRLFSRELDSAGDAESLAERSQPVLLPAPANEEEPNIRPPGPETGERPQERGMIVFGV
jgi:hypothetical protein